MRLAATARPGLLLLLLSGCAERADPLAPDLPVAYSIAEAPDWTVNALDDVVDADGCTAEHCSLREAVRGATSGQTIGFAVTGTIVLAAPLPLLILEDVAIHGPGSDRLTIDASALAQHPHFLVRPEADARVTGLRLTGGSGEFGGAIHNQGTLALDRLVVENNTSGLGGGIFNLGTMTLTNSVVRANIAHEGGGGVFNDGSLTAGNIDVHGNDLVYTGASVPGGGGLVNAGTMVLRHSRITSNRVLNGTSGYGGGLHNSSAGATGIVEHTLFADNEAPLGGAIHNTEHLIVRRSEIRGNRAARGGGAILVGRGSLEIENSLLEANSVVSSDPAFATSGGAILNFTGTLGLRHVNVVGNVLDNAFGRGAAIASGGPLHLLNSVVAGNTSAGDYVDVSAGVGPAHDIRGNVLGELEPWMPVPDASNLVGAIVDGGDWHAALGLALAPDVDGLFRYRVLAGSPVIDRGVSDGCTAHDVAGTARPQGAACDAGAVEYEPDLAPPAVALVQFPLDPLAVGSAVQIRASVDDTEHGSSMIAGAMLSLDDFTSAIPMHAVDGVLDSPAEVVEGTLTTPSTPGIYALCVRASDAAGNTGAPACATLVVYDPAAGFVTGGGWIDSPAGAYAADPAAAGRATFGFVARYRKGAHVPDGQTRFVFHAAGMTFESSAYEWLVVAGSRAQFKGTGTIAGRAGVFGFMLTAVDGDPDRLRLRIVDPATDAVVYDNGTDQTIGGGSIVVHQP